jgi:hypothetical protein
MTATFPQRKRQLFDSSSLNPFKLSRSKVELFCDCPRCFYLDVKKGVGRPPMLPFTLNNAVDALLKNEFDDFRKKNAPHPLFAIHQLPFTLFDHPELPIWQENFKGMTFHDQENNFLLTGAIDDLWLNEKKELIIVDYKATSKDQAITTESGLYSAYKRQMEFYQWLFEKAGFKVAPEGYFVYCNGIKNKPFFKRHLEFQVHLIPYQGSKEWIEPTLKAIKNCLLQETAPAESASCEYCLYANRMKNF